MFTEWKIEKIVKKGEYLYAVVPEHPKATKNGYVLHHRVVAENVIGRELLDSEIVHHIDGNKHNNLPSNLQVMDSSEHSRLHKSTGRSCADYTCPNCGIEFSRELRQSPKSKGTKLAFCSRKCNGAYYSNKTDNLRKKDTSHGINMYRYGCRCPICKGAKSEKYRKSKL